MKPALASLCVLVFSLTCHAQTERWQISIPILNNGLTNSGVFPDGVGGGAILLQASTLPTFMRLAWFNAAGTVLLTNDYKDNAKGPDTRAEILHVTPKILDVKVLSRTTLGERVFLQRFSAKDGLMTETPLSVGSKNVGDENVASFGTRHPDKRGFFTVQSSTTNVLVRRYTF